MAHHLTGALKPEPHSGPRVRFNAGFHAVCRSGRTTPADENRSENVRLRTCSFTRGLAEGGPRDTKGTPIRRFVKR